tara:strand:- start:1863 stop:2387 length:525 start_codon:yes stop_codon:yes gene_type:complete
MRLFNVRYSVFMLVVGCGVLSDVTGQTPDWMFALEGTYVGRLEVMDGESKTKSDVRLDGLRNGDEDGFVLQFATSTEQGIRERVEMWSWDDQAGQVQMTTLEDNKPTKFSWFVNANGRQVVLSRGGSENGRAVLIEYRIQRFPGELRLNRFINDGSGEWVLRDRYILDEEEIED